MEGVALQTVEYLLLVQHQQDAVLQSQLAHLLLVGLHKAGKIGLQHLRACALMGFLMQ